MQRNRILQSTVVHLSKGRKSSLSIARSSSSRKGRNSGSSTSLSEIRRKTENEKEKGLTQWRRPLIDFRLERTLYTRGMCPNDWCHLDTLLDTGETETNKRETEEIEEGEITW